MLHIIHTTHALYYEWKPLYFSQLKAHTGYIKCKLSTILWKVSFSNINMIAPRPINSRSEQPGNHKAWQWAVTLPALCQASHFSAQATKTPQRPKQKKHLFV